MEDRNVAERPPSRRGAPQREQGEMNRRKVYEWFQKNPCGHIYECAEAVGMHSIRVGSHVRAIRAGWRPE